MAAVEVPNWRRCQRTPPTPDSPGLPFTIIALGNLLGSVVFTDLKITNDLWLRLIAARDAEELFALVEKNRSHLRMWLPWLDSNTALDDTEAFLHDSVSLAEAKQAAVFGINEHRTLIGVAGYNQIDWEHYECCL